MLVEFLVVAVLSIIICFPDLAWMFSNIFIRTIVIP